MEPSTNNNPGVFGSNSTTLNVKEYNLQVLVEKKKIIFCVYTCTF
jgi:hypothetical protein